MQKLVVLRLRRIRATPLHTTEFHLPALQSQGHDKGTLQHSNESHSELGQERAFPSTAHGLPMTQAILALIGVSISLYAWAWALGAGSWKN